MKKEVLVRVKGSFAVTGTGTPDAPEIEIITDGEYYEQGNLRCVVYEEVDPDFPEPIRNVICINGQEVTIKKRGLINTDMIFHRNVEKTTHYSTPYGDIILGVNAESIVISESGSSLSIDIGYELALNYSHVSDCRVVIQVQDR